MIYVHKRTQTLYRILYEAKVKIDGRWQECVVYYPIGERADERWVRLKPDFERGFEPFRDRKLNDPKQTDS